MDIKWPEGATHKIDGIFKKWVDGSEYFYSKGNDWVRTINRWQLVQYKMYGDYELIERPIDAQYMPEVGECEYQLEDGPWDKCFFIGKSKDGRFVYEIRHCLLARSDLVKFRPIKSDREQFIEKARESDGGTYSIVEIFGKLYDKGFKAPE
jgi:hypothetical protein